jgi:gliding motility-associated-like protein
LAEGCPPHAVQFTDLSQDAIAHIWNFGDGSPVSNFPQPQHIYEKPGDYTVTHTAIGIGNCASMKSTIVVHVRDTVVADFRTEPSFPVTLSFPTTGVQFYDATNAAANWQWDFGDGIRSTELNPNHIYHEEGTFFVTLNAWSDEGCKSTVIHGPFIIAAPDLFIPNVFSPNDDGLNDFFLPMYSGAQPYALQIFDRWGVPYFQTVVKTMPWNGKTESGDPLPEGVYYYVLKIGEKEYAGHVTLVR